MFAKQCDDSGNINNLLNQHVFQHNLLVLVFIKPTTIGSLAHSDSPGTASSARAKNGSGTLNSTGLREKGWGGGDGKRGWPMYVHSSSGGELSISAVKT